MAKSDTEIDDIAQSPMAGEKDASAHFAKLENQSAVEDIGPEESVELQTQDFDDEELVPEEVVAEEVVVEEFEIDEIESDELGIEEPETPEIIYSKPPAPTVYFRDLGFSEEILSSIRKTGYESCTPIQTLAIPHILKGHDVAGLAQTGTGKTAAFLLPLMERMLRGQKVSSPVGYTANETESASIQSDTSLEAQDDLSIDSAHVESSEKSTENSILSYQNKSSSSEQVVPFENWKNRQFVLVLVPTRELCEQVIENVEKFKGDIPFRAVSIYGGVSYQKQIQALKEGVEFIVATPGRLLDLYKENLVDLKQVRAIVFDEADRMFDMGFKDDMKFILQRVPRERQFLVFSATLNLEVLNTAYQYGAHPVEVNISRDEARAENVEDMIYHVGQDEKARYLLSLLKKEKPKQAIIFSNFKMNINRVAKFLQANGFPALGISSMLSQAQRQRVIDQFKSDDEQNILVATDVAARGLDIKGVDMVINFELPDDAENYVHRIGRTGRAGQKGRAISLVSDMDVESLSRIEAYLKNKVQAKWLEDSELVSDYLPFPGHSEGYKSQGGGSGFSAGGSRKPRTNGSGGGRPNGQNRQSTEPRREGQKENKDQRPRNNEGVNTNLKNSRASAPPQDGERVHRDRRTGRHGETSEAATQPREKSAKTAVNGRSQETTSAANRPAAKHGESYSRAQLKPGEITRHTKSAQSKNTQSKPDGKRQNKGSQNRNENRSYKKTGSAPQGITSKVKSFFKKLFS